MADEVRFTEEQLEALAAKLDTLDLTEDERAVVHAVFDAASPQAEVSGYSLNQGSLSDGFMNVFQQGDKAGFGDSDRFGIRIIIVPKTA